MDTSATDRDMTIGTSSPPSNKSCLARIDQTRAAGRDSVQSQTWRTFVSSQARPRQYTQVNNPAHDKTASPLFTPVSFTTTRSPIQQWRSSPSSQLRPSKPAHDQRHVPAQSSTTSRRHVESVNQSTVIRCKEVTDGAHRSVELRVWTKSHRQTTSQTQTSLLPSLPPLVRARNPSPPATLMRLTQRGTGISQAPVSQITSQIPATQLPAWNPSTNSHPQPPSRPENVDDPTSRTTKRNSSTSATSAAC